MGRGGRNLLKKWCCKNLVNKYFSAQTCATLWRHTVKVSPVGAWAGELMIIKFSLLEFNGLVQIIIVRQLSWSLGLTMLVMSFNNSVNVWPQRVRNVTPSRKLPDQSQTRHGMSLAFIVVVSLSLSCFSWNIRAVNIFQIVIPSAQVHETLHTNWGSKDEVDFNVIMIYCSFPSCMANTLRS